MKKTLISAILIGIFGISCKKDDSNSGNGGTNSGGSSIFFSFNNGDSWNYRTDSANVTLSQFTLTSTNRDTTAYAKSFHIFESNDGTTTTQEYYNVSGSSYYQLANLTTLLPTLQLKYLVTTAAVNSYWDTTINTIVPIQTYNFNLTAKVRQTVEQNNGTLVVNGILYDSVIKMKTEILNANASTQIQILPAPFPPSTVNIPINIIQDIHSYYAPRVGQIKRDYAINATADLSSLSALSTTVPDSMNLINTNRTTILLNSTVQ